jgi:DNA modification methylase
MAKNGPKGNEVKQTGLYWPEKGTEVERVILPFQTVETINESKADREKLTLFRQKGETAPGWRNKLIWGDNKYIMASLLPEFAGKVNLIYIDPPFATGADFSVDVKVGDQEWTKEASIIEEKVYRDTWGRGLDSYLQMMYDRLALMRELLTADGSIFVHLDWRVVHFVKIIMDELFGTGINDSPGFRNEIIWFHNVLGTGKRTFPKTHETIIWYSKSSKWIINPDDDNVRVPYSDRITKTLKKDEKGWYYVRGNRESSGSATGKWFKTYVDPKEIEKGKFAADVWEDIKSYRAQGVDEFTGFPTQKPEKLLYRIISACSTPGNLVADFFSGAGTTLAVAEKLGRRWIGADLSKFAIHTTRKRLLDIPGCRPFEVLNLGRYQKAKLKENGVSRYLDFILKLYRAEPLAGYPALHGKKAGRMVHIGDVDSIVTEREIREVVKECAAAGVKAIDILGWDFEMGLHDLVDRIGEDYGVKIRLVQIPREALEVRSPDREEVKFFDLNYLEVVHDLKGKNLTVSLKDFVISNPEYLPDEVREKIKKFTDYIDY